MKITTQHFCNHPVGYKKVLSSPGKHEMKKKMITTSMLRQQVWMVNDEEFNHILENSKRGT